MTERQHSRPRGGYHLSSKSHAARTIDMREQGNSTLELDDPEFNQRFGRKGADLPFREPSRSARRPRPARESDTLMD